MSSLLIEFGGLALVTALAYFHFRGYKSPEGHAVTRALDSYYGIWWQPTRPAFLLMAILFALIGLLGVVIMGLRLVGRV